jgi:hypothetical protein
MPAEPMPVAVAGRFQPAAPPRDAPRPAQFARASSFCWRAPPGVFALLHESQDQARVDLAAESANAEARRSSAAHVAFGEPTSTSL